MKTVSFGGAFPLEYQRGKAPDGHRSQFTPEQEAHKKAEVGDLFAQTVSKVTGRDAERVSLNDGDFLLIDGPKERTLSVFRAIKKGMGPSRSLEEEQATNHLILVTMNGKKRLNVFQSPLTLRYGNSLTSDTSPKTEQRIERFFEKQGISKALPVSTEPVLPKQTASFADRAQSYLHTDWSYPAPKGLNPAVAEFNLGN